MDEPRNTVTVTIPLEQWAGLSARIGELAKEATERLLKQEVERLRDESQAELAHLSWWYNYRIDKLW